jgi:natural product biosynthesis luciferase-like monooxygenase protein
VNSESAFFIGEVSLLTETATRWLDAGHTIVGIAAHDASIRTFANARSIPLLDPTDHGAILAFSFASPFTTLLSVANLAMLPEKLITAPSRYAINFHDGPLPRYAGLNATTWAIAAGERTHGVTWHEMTAKADAGRILMQRSIDIAEDETALSLNAKCWAAGIDSFEQLLQQITSGSVEPREQATDSRSYFGRNDRPGAASVLDFQRSSEDISALVRSLDFGNYANPLATARMLVGDAALYVGEAQVVSGATGVPGHVLAVEKDSITVATANGAVRLSRLARFDGGSVSLPAAGTALPLLSDDARSSLTELSRRVSRDERYFHTALESWANPDLTFLSHRGDTAAQTFSVAIPATIGTAGANSPIAGALAFLARSSASDTVHVSFSEERLDTMLGQWRSIFADEVPLAVTVEPAQSFSVVGVSVGAQLDALRTRTTWPRDLLVRQPTLRQLPRRDNSIAASVHVRLQDNVDAATRRASADLTVVIAADGSTMRWMFAPDTIDATSCTRIQRQLQEFLQRVSDTPDAPLASISRLSTDDERVMAAFNDTARNIPTGCVHDLIQDRVRETPDAVALRFRNQTLSYRELDQRANCVAHALRANGVGAETCVGVYVDRSPEMVIAVLAIWKAGGAYVPLDPTYPADRIAFMVSDAKITTVLAQSHLTGSIVAKNVLAIDTGTLAGTAEHAPQSQSTPANLAYLIYTSGSTGTPKGVMVEHGNVVNFFAGMDDRLGVRSGEPSSATRPDIVWLAVTSLSFDISVLELFWTLARGSTVVIYREPSRQAMPVADTRAIDMSFFYFSSGEESDGPDKYRLLLEGAKFADTHGFSAVWTPERHFHEFGGLYPNPAVTSAALATITNRVALRAGSCVSPLHSPIRIAEDWSVVDNLSNGRVGISFAAGWQPNDFVIRPHTFADRKRQMFRDIETVRKLWRGESVEFTDASGREVPVSIRPRPIQKELPFWVTAAGNPETFEEAGRVGANVLTHLLGQTFAELRDKVAVYRRARAAAGHEGRGNVTIMLHTFVTTDRAKAKETVRQPMKGYLRSSLGLIKEAAWSFPTFKQGTTLSDGSFSIDHLSAEDMDALLDHSFDRYYSTSGLFGDVDEAMQTVDKVRACDIDEIACLIDFGVEANTVLANLPTLAQVQQRAAKSAASSAGNAEPDVALAELARQHGVTHLQCTPTMAAMLVGDAAGRTALSSLDTMLVGGEALPLPLARELRTLVPGKLINMYGPTETTVWSTSWDVPQSPDAVSIGTPLANTDICVLDRSLQRAPLGEVGELAIGGRGVTRGYYERQELTAERFVAHPERSAERLYRTGDLAQLHSNGVLEFHGRIDHQVKIRGHRIELGEIEARVLEHGAVREAIIMAHEFAPGDVRLVSYCIAASSDVPDAVALKSHLRSSLPDFMIPSTFVWLPRWPLTPNGKVDRKALRPTEAPRRVEAPTRAPSSDLEGQIAAIWCELLSLPSVGADDNFFDIGGHSLLSAQLLLKLKPLAAGELSLVDMFRFPTVRQLAKFMQKSAEPATASTETAARAESRMEGTQRRDALMQRRRGVR